MGFTYSHVIRPILFRFSPETAHSLGLHFLDLAGGCRVGRSILRTVYGVPSDQKPVRLWDLEFPNVIGVAAGMDKDAIAIDGLFALGFGCVEVGTVTPLPQSGNPKPRLFRYPAHHAVVNRMGFNNAGADAMASHLARWSLASTPRGVLGVNLGKQKETPLDEAANDYLKSFRILADHAGYIAVNISSPNTKDLRKLQGGEFLSNILNTLNTANADRINQGKRRVPLLLKIAPDLSPAEIDAIVGAVLSHAWDGLIATNTTIDRSAPYDLLEKQGGLSGKPVFERSNSVLKQVCDLVAGKIPVIGVGGIETADDVQIKLELGASLVQVYTGFIYQGPSMANSILRRLAHPHGSSR